MPTLSLLYLGSDAEITRNVLTTATIKHVNYVEQKKLESSQTVFAPDTVYA